MRKALLALLVALALPACNNVQTPEMPSFLDAKKPANARQLRLPGSYVGSGDRAARSPSEEAAAATPNEAQLRSAYAARNQQAGLLWERAEATQGDARKADLYETIADDYPEYPRAAEARYRQGLHLYRSRDWMDAVRALQSYVAIAPVNPHLPEVEEMIYRAGLARLAERRGLLAIFQNDDDGLEVLRYVSTTFPAGEYPDDALLTLGRHYQKDPEELQRAMLYFKELLLRYPDSEWSFEARRALGDTYALRDQGSAYHAGFVDRDPREDVPDDERAQAHAGAVHSSLGMALDEYEKYLERLERDPARQAEYSAQVNAVTVRRRALREGLAQKDDRIAAFYAQRGQHKAAAVYRRSAAQWRGQPVASLREVTGCAVPPAPGPGLPLGSDQPPRLAQPRMPAQPPRPVQPPRPAQPTRSAPQPRVPVAPRGASMRGTPPPPPPPSWPAGR